MSEKVRKKGIGRREFIKGVAMVTGAAAVDHLGTKESMAEECTCETPKWDKEADVLIIGSGFAGLSAWETSPKSHSRNIARRSISLASAAPSSTSAARANSRSTRASCRTPTPG